jgi:hypothetical protein
MSCGTASTTLVPEPRRTNGFHSPIVNATPKGPGKRLPQKEALSDLARGGTGADDLATSGSRAAEGSWPLG